MPVITISRQYGSGAVRIAERVCELLGYTYFDKSLMIKVAAEMGISEEGVVDFSEDQYRMRNFFERLFGRRRIRSEVLDVDRAESFLRLDALSEAEGIDLVRDTVRAAYNHDNVVIVGRGGQAILREKPGVLHVRLHAPLGARALRVKERSNYTLGQATDLVRNKDESAAAYLARFYEIDWDNTLLYHLVINTGKWELLDVAEIIISALTNLKTPS
jgi:CMP/dCMP kinase